MLLAVGALHPMVWQYANEARPYIMIYAGAQMVLAYLLHLHARIAWQVEASPLASAIFVVGGILLFGASLLGAFWVFAAGVYAIHLHHRHLGWRYLARGAHPALLGCFVVVVSLLSLYYISSLLQGAGGSRVSKSTPASLAFAAYELMGLSGLGPGRHDLREGGQAALRPYAPGLLAAAAIITITLGCGLREALRRLGPRGLALVIGLALMPVFIVVLSGFVMGWRVLGRHLFATVPVFSLVLALGLAWLWDGAEGRQRLLRRLAAAACLVALACSALAMRFAEQHRKDDYRLAAAIAQEALSRGERVWWAADYLGANYYRLPGSFDHMGELTGVHQPPSCTDLPGVQATSNLSAACMQTMSPPDTVVFSRPETFDKSGDIGRYLQARNYVKVQEMPAIAIWRSAATAAPK
jgi:MFS family permease